MNTNAIPHAVSGIVGLSAFSVAVVVGLAIDNPAAEIMERALVSMVGGSFAGLMVGFAARAAVSAGLRSIHKKSPAPEATPPAPAAAKAAA